MTLITLTAGLAGCQKKEDPPGGETPETPDLTHLPFGGVSPTNILIRNQGSPNPDFLSLWLCGLPPDGAGADNADDWTNPDGTYLSGSKAYLITSIRGNDVGKYAFDPLRLPFIQTALRNADAITSVATSLIDFADRTITPIAHKSSTILNGIDVLALKPKARPSIKLGGLIIGSIGLFRYKKGLVYLCKALETLAPKDAMPFTLLLIGDYFKEADRQAHEVLFEKYGLQGRTVVTGRVAHTDIADYLQLLDIAVFPSLFSEGCPLSMLEAMAMGKAIVASNSGAIPEIIQHRVHGLLVKAGSATEIAEALLELTEDAQLRTRLGRNAKAAAAKMTIERERRQWLSVYDKISTIKTHSH